MRILIVEDERLARNALKQILEQDGYDVLTAPNGEDAVKTAVRFDPDVVITDWRLPGLSGEPLCRELRSCRPRVPIIIVSSADEAFSSPVDVNVRLRKPLDVRRLREILGAEYSGRSFGAKSRSVRRRNGSRL